jgi:hypothetical protein
LLIRFNKSIECSIVHKLLESEQFFKGITRDPKYFAGGNDKYVEGKVGKVASDEVFIWAQALITNPLDFETLRELNIDWNASTNTFS